MRKAVVANRAEVVRPLVGKQQRHPIEDQCLDDPRDQPLTEADDIQIGVEVAREADQRPTVIVAVAIEQPVERVLQSLPHRLGEQDHDGGRQHRDDPVARVAVVREKIAGQIPHPEIHRDAGGDEHGIDQAALDDDFDVAQPVSHQRTREGERHQAEGDGRELQRQRRIDAHRPRQGIAQRKGRHAEHRAPRNPPHLPARRRRPQLAERPDQDDERHDGADEQIRQLQAVEQAEKPRKQRPIRRRPRQGEDPAGPQRQRRKIQERDDELRGQAATSRAASGRQGPLGKDQHEMQEQRGQKCLSDGVAPVEHPVQTVQRSVEGKREGTEERDAEPEEMERRGISRAPDAHRRTDHQREEPDAGEDEIHRAPARSRRQRDLQRLARSQAQQQVGQPRPVARTMLLFNHVRRGSHRQSVHRFENVARPDSCRFARRPGHDLDCRHPFSARRPVDAVFDLLPLWAERHVLEAQHDEDDDHSHRECGSTPGQPACFHGPLDGIRASQ